MLQANGGVPLKDHELDRYFTSARYMCLLTNFRLGASVHKMNIKKKTTPLGDFGQYDNYEYDDYDYEGEGEDAYESYGDLSNPDRKPRLIDEQFDHVL